MLSNFRGFVINLYWFRLVRVREREIIMHILILGGDGYLGWPTAMHLSAQGYDVTVVDNYFRRNACTELDVGMLYPLPTLPERARTWHQKTGKEIKVVIGI